MFEICKLKSGTTIIEAGPGRIVTEHPEEGRQIISIISDWHEPSGYRVQIVSTPANLPVELSVAPGHSR